MISLFIGCVLFSSVDIKWEPQDTDPTPLIDTASEMDTSVDEYLYDGTYIGMFETTANWNWESCSGSLEIIVSEDGSDLGSTSCSQETPPSLEGTIVYSFEGTLVENDGIMSADGIVTITDNSGFSFDLDVIGFCNIQADNRVLMELEWILDWSSMSGHAELWLH